MRNIRQILVFAFGYITAGIPIAAGAPFLGLRLSPMIAAAAMALSSQSVVTNSNCLRGFEAPTLPPLELAPGEPEVEESLSAASYRPRYI